MSRHDVDDPVMSQALRQAQLRVDEEVNTQNIIADALMNRPKGTSNAFGPKQKEFVKWAKEKGYVNPEVVTEAKVAYFLNEQVIGRLHHKNATKKVGISTVNQYISALTSLWKYQVQYKVNSNTTPRGFSVISIQKFVKQNTFMERKTSYYDRGRLYQHLLTQELQVTRRKVADYFWSYRQTTFCAFKGLRNRVGYLLAEQGLLRGENIRDAELPDFFTVEMEDEGPSHCVALTVLKGRGKMNQYGKPVFSGYYRHSDVRLCSVSAVALYMFFRYHVSKEPFPDLSCSPQWYDISFFCTDIKSNTTAVSKSAHALAIETAHKTLKIMSTHKTHGGRHYGRQKLEQSGVDKVSADVAGGWSTNAGEGCYGNGLSRPAMRAMAGFPADEKMYHLPRGTVTPPEVLQKQIFPELEEWERRHIDGDDCEPNFALRGFLRMLRFLRDVILQDAAVLMDDYPHIVFDHPIFSSAEFLTFKGIMKEVIATTVHPVSHDIQRVMPELCRQIATGNECLMENLINAIRSASNAISNKVDKNQLELQVSVNSLRRALTTSLSNAVTTFEQLNVRELNDTTVNGTVHTSLDTTMYDATINDNVPAAINTTMPSLQEVPNAAVPPHFHDVISASVTTVPDVLTEWVHGINGKSSVASVEAQWGTQWRVGSQIQKMFSRRRIIVSLIERYAQNKGLTIEAAAWLIEEKRLKKNISLMRLADTWKAFEMQELR